MQTCASPRSIASGDRMRKLCRGLVGLTRSRIAHNDASTFVMAIAALLSLPVSAGDLPPASVYVAPGGVYIGSAKVYVEPRAGNERAARRHRPTRRTCPAPARRPMGRGAMAPPLRGRACTGVRCVLAALMRRAIHPIPHIRAAGPVYREDRPSGHGSTCRPMRGKSNHRDIPGKNRVARWGDPRPLNPKPFITSPADLAREPYTFMDVFSHKAWTPSRHSPRLHSIRFDYGDDRRASGFIEDWGLRLPRARVPIHWLHRQGLERSRSALEERRAAAEWLVAIKANSIPCPQKPLKLSRIRLEAH